MKCLVALVLSIPLIAQSQPCALTVNASATDVLCNGDNTGELSASASGGTGTLAYVWQSCLGGPMLGGQVQTDMFAGCYGVTVTDVVGCTATASVTISEPMPYVFVASQDSVSCFGLADGQASIAVSGNTPPYQYLWDNGDMTPISSGQSAGFHFVTVTDANLCQAVSFVEVLEPPLLFIADIFAQNASCFNGNNGMATVIPQGGTPSYSYLWDDAAGQNTPTASMLAPGPYMVWVSDHNGCTAIGVVDIGSPPSLNLSVSNVQGERCSGDCAGQATAIASGGVGGYLYQWGLPHVPESASTATGICPGTYTITLQDANGCTASAAYTVPAAQPLDVQVSGMAPLCPGQQNGFFQSNATGGTAPYQYLWSNGSTVSDPQNLPCGPYSLTISDFNNCTIVTSTLLTCPQPIVVNGIVSQPTQCFGGNNGSLEALANGGAQPLAYLWNDPLGQATASVQNLQAGTYTVTVSDANGCSVTASGEVAQPALLTVSASTTPASCLNFSDGTATANPAGGKEPYQYSWGATGNTQTIVNLSAGIYFVTVTDANLCTATTSAIVGQPASQVSVTATQTRRACWGENSGEASVSASGSNGAPFTFAWSNGQVGGGASALAPGLYTVTAYDAKGCTSVQSVAIQQLDTIEVKVAHGQPTCAGYSDGVVAVVEILGGLGMGDTTQYNYAWSLPNAPNSTVVTGVAAGIYTLTVTDFQGCSEQISFTVFEPPAILLQTMQTDIACFGQANGMASVVSVQNAVGVPVYQWSNNSTDSQIGALSAGTYTVTVTDSKGCTATFVFAIQEPLPLNLQFDISSLVCSDDKNARILAKVSGGVSPYIFTWANGSADSMLQNLGFGDYALTVTDRNGCTLIGNATVAQPAQLQCQVIATPPLCFGGHDGRLQLLVEGGNPPLRYSVNGSDFGGSSVFIALPTGNYTLVVMDGSGCTASASAVLMQPPPIEVFVGLDTTLTLGDSLLLTSTVNNAVGTVKLVWSSALADNLRCLDPADCDEVLVKPAYTNTYRLKATDENGCMGTGEIRVRVLKPRGIYVPTAFSPNGDFENDLLLVHGKSRQIEKVTVFKVFDRWGELLYEDRDFSVNDNSRGWDGTFRGQPCDPGVYVWLLEVLYKDGQTEWLNGNTTLIR